jgi:RloB-like protein
MKQRKVFMPDRRRNIQRDTVSPRIENKRDYSIWVIAFEGGKTEGQYFNKFGSSKIKIVPLSTRSGDSTEPEDIFERMRDYKRKNIVYDDDKCWLVVDVDDRNEERLKTVCVQARAERCQVAISNPCFEFWLFLHKFEADELPLTIHQLAAEKRPHEMKQILKYDYKSLPYHEFCADVKRATQRAKSKEQGRRTHIPGFPGTDVYKLVETLPVKVVAE